MHRSRRLIINADDFGISRGVNDGIVEAAQAGGITSTSLMVNMPASADAMMRARQCPRISVGLHFNLTVGAAVTGSSSLTQGSTGEFYSLSKLLAAASLGITRGAFAVRLHRARQRLEKLLPPETTAEDPT